MIKKHTSCWLAELLMQLLQSWLLEVYCGAIPLDIQVTKYTVHPTAYVDVIFDLVVLDCLRIETFLSRKYRPINAGCALSITFDRR